MNQDKSINIKDLPHPPQDVDIKQPEEFIDQSSIRKDENDTPPNKQEKEAEKKSQPVFPAVKA